MNAPGIDSPRAPRAERRGGWKYFVPGGAGRRAGGARMTAPGIASPRDPRAERRGVLNYFVTGATGFIGRHLVEELLKREGTIYVLVREGSRGQSDALAGGPGAG